MSGAETALRPHTTDEAQTWSTARNETDKYGRPTGARWVRCLDCGVEVLVRGRDHATHRPECEVSR